MGVALAAGSSSPICKPPIPRRWPSGIRGLETAELGRRSTYMSVPQLLLVSFPQMLLLLDSQFWIRAAGKKSDCSRSIPSVAAPAISTTCAFSFAAEPPNSNRKNRPSVATFHRRPVRSSGRGTDGASVDGGTGRMIVTFESSRRRWGEEHFGLCRWS